MTIVEVLVAALVVALGALAVLALVNATSRANYRAQGSQVVTDRLQAELEHIRQLSFDEVALTGPAPSSTDPSSPTARVSGTQFALNRNGTNAKPLAIAGGTAPSGTSVGCGGDGQLACGVSPGGPGDPASRIDQGNIHGWIYRYVVYQGAPSDCLGCSNDDYKRVVVAITLDTTASGGTHTIYREIQSNVANPDAVPGSNPVPPCSSNPNDPSCSPKSVGTFWLTDTPCNNTSRQEVAALPGFNSSQNGNATHNTRGKCSNGMQTGSTSGAPDLMFEQARPPDTDAPDQYLYDYSTDVGRTETQPCGATSPLRCGLAMQKLSQNGCLLQQTTSLAQLSLLNLGDDFLDLPSSESNRQYKTHVWLSNELNNNFSLLTSADASLDLWTRTVGGASYPGKICVTVFKRVTLNLQGLSGLCRSTSRSPSMCRPT